MSSSGPPEVMKTSVQRSIWSVAAVSFSLAISATDCRADQSVARIVGAGAASCAEVLKDVLGDPSKGAEYLIWAQGYMSGILISRPPGVDISLDLSPDSFGPREQLKFLTDRCSSKDAHDFADAVEDLYVRLREENAKNK